MQTPVGVGLGRNEGFLSNFIGDATFQTRDRIAEIAEYLGQPKSVFFDKSFAAQVHETDELLRLWHGLDNSADRRKIIALARAMISGRS